MMPTRITGFIEKALEHFMSVYILSGHDGVFALMLKSFMGKPTR
jgi:hypothetical protein